MNVASPRLLILTLHSGEAGLDTLKAQLKTQSFQNFDHVVIAGLGNQAAHRRLFETVMAEADRYDLFLKLDADMSLRSDRALADMLRAAATRPEVRYFVFEVHDCFTERQIRGVMLFRSGLRWSLDSRETLFVDIDPVGESPLFWSGPPVPFLDHGAVVSDFECFCFGVHKMLKVLQRGRPDRSRAKARAHLANVTAIRRLYRKTGLTRHRLALAGVAWTLARHDLTELADKATLEALYADVVVPEMNEWQARADRLADNTAFWLWTLGRELGWRRLPGLRRALFPL